MLCQQPSAVNVSNFVQHRHGWFCFPASVNAAKMNTSVSGILSILRVNPLEDIPRNGIARPKGLDLFKILDTDCYWHSCQSGRILVWFTIYAFIYVLSALLRSNNITHINCVSLRCMKWLFDTHICWEVFTMSRLENTSCASWRALISSGNLHSAG